MPEMELVTAFCPLTTAGNGDTALQTAGKTRFVVDCNANPVALVGHDKTTFAPGITMVSCGGGNERLNTVPLPELPPADVVPYKVLLV